MFLFGLVNDAYMIPLVFLLKGITFGVYSVGIAVIYDFCPKDKLKLQFTLIIVVSIMIAKVVGKLGSVMYNFFDNSFLAVNSIVGITIGIFLAIFTVFFESTSGPKQEDK